MKKVTGLSLFQGNYYSYILENNKLRVEQVFDKKSHLDFLLDPSYPIWLVRHSLGKDMGPEDYSQLSEEVFLSQDRGKNYGIHQKSGQVKDLFYHGLQVPCPEDSYSHAVGPIHAGIIEPGHFRFVVTGEVIRHLTIRLGFQHRAWKKSIIGKSLVNVLPYAEAISGDSSLSYAIATARCFEEAIGYQAPDSLETFRAILVELERISQHIADLAGLAEDMGYYPLYGVCVTDRGAALGLLESLLGNRFGRGATRLGGISINKKRTDGEITSAWLHLVNIYRKKIRPAIKRALAESTLRERMQSNGTLSPELIQKEGLIGFIARMGGLDEDLRFSDPIYSQLEPIATDDKKSQLLGDVWARFYLRYLEIEQSMDWVSKQWNSLPWDELRSLKPIYGKKIVIEKPGIFTKALESWRGPILVSYLLQKDGTVEDVYIRDPSVLNWHGLELAVKGCLLGDFPLNNKSFNLSYVGFDL